MSILFFGDGVPGGDRPLVHGDVIVPLLVIEGANLIEEAGILDGFRVAGPVVHDHNFPPGTLGADFVNDGLHDVALEGVEEIEHVVIAVILEFPCIGAYFICCNVIVFLL